MLMNMKSHTADNLPLAMPCLILVLYYSYKLVRPANWQAFSVDEYWMNTVLCLINVTHV